MSLVFESGGVMKKVVGVSFTKKGKVYNFDPATFVLEIDDKVIVETGKGLQFGYVASEMMEVEDDTLIADLKPVLRLASKKDEGIHACNVNDAERALLKAMEFVRELNLDMKILDASFTFDRNQLLFNFIADERVDFRELAKKLAQVYRTRIELRQIGVRDKAKEIGGLGPCGRILCCNSFLNDLNSVTINMAKNQMLSLNPTKINGVCGRLLCCLGYEDKNYTELKKGLPNIGQRYEGESIIGKVISVDIFKRTIKIEKDDGNIQEVQL